MDNVARNYRFGLLGAYYAIQNSPGIVALIASKGAACLYGEHACELRVLASV